MKLPFEEAYLVSLAERPDRYEKMRKKFDYFGWDVTDFRVVTHPHSDFIVKLLGCNLGGRGFSIYNGAIFNCAREQYTLVKSAYLRGVETLAIFEDDASFIKDKSVWEEYFNNLPEDWDILRINCLRGEETDLMCDKQEGLWCKQPANSAIYGAAFYVVNRKAMKYLIDRTDLLYQPLDNALAFMNDPTMNVYVPRIPLSLCLEDSVDSNLRENYFANPIFSAYLKTRNFKRENYI